MGGLPGDCACDHPEGADADAYYVEQLPSYYLQAGEPRGVWHGMAARELGLAGEVGDDAFLALMAGMDPRGPERDLGRPYNDESVRGFDVTASAPKSVSVLWALGDEHTRQQVLAAHDAAVSAMAGALTSVGVGGWWATDGSGCRGKGVASAYEDHLAERGPGRHRTDRASRWHVAGRIP